MAATAYPVKADLSMFQEQRERLGAAMAKDLSADETTAALISGESEIPRNYSDTDFLFRQNGYMVHQFGYHEPDAFGAVLAKSGKGVLFVKRLPSEYAMWMGPLPTLDDIKARYGVDHCFYADQLLEGLEQLGVKTVQVMNGKNSDSGHAVTCRGIEGKLGSIAVKDEYLFEALTNLRVFKTEKEIAFLTEINKHSSLGHVAAMQAAKPNLGEHVMEATFKHYTYLNGGHRDVSYGYICASGPRCATLHYPNNDRTMLDGELALLDMGGSYLGYASDITTTFPVNGKFTDNQKLIYNAVLEANNAVKSSVKPGVSWVDMHTLALRTIAGHLIKANIIVGATVDEVMAQELMVLFMPHGLGHMIGIDVHDVGGYPAGGVARPTKGDHKRLRTARVLQPGMMITCEPGCYFNQVLLEEAFAKPDVAKYLNVDKIRNEFWNFGGVRLEDDIFVTETGVLNPTCVPRTTEEIEAVMAGGKWDWKVEILNNA